MVPKSELDKVKRQLATVNKRMDAYGPRQDKSAQFVPAKGAGALPSMVLTKCAKLFANAVINPFDAKTGACVPDSTNEMTKRTKYFTRGSFAAGTNGEGWIYIDTRAVGLNDRDCIMATESTSSFTALDASAIAPVVSTYAMENSEFNVQSLSEPLPPNPGVNARRRIVSLGVRTKATGVQINLAGTIVGISEPDNINMDDFTFSDLEGYQAATPVAVTDARDWVSLLYVPKDEEDLKFEKPDATLLPRMAFMVKGAEPGASFAFEVTVHLEWTGTLGDTVPSENDPVGYGAVQTIRVKPEYMGGRLPEKSVQHTQATFLERVAKATISGVSGINKFVHDHGAQIAGGFATLAAFL